MDILNTLKEEVSDMIEDKVQDIRGEIKDNLDNIFNDDLQNNIVDAINKEVNIPLISAGKERIAINYIYDILEEKVKDAIRKAL